MEEILASIRQIISENDTGKKAVEPPQAAPGGDILELTREVREDGTVVNLAAETETFAHQATLSLTDRKGGETRPAPRAEADPLGAAAASAAELEALARAAEDRHGETGGGRTVEEVVEDAVRPMVREWLDRNLPALVEQMIGREIERLMQRTEDVADR